MKFLSRWLSNFSLSAMAGSATLPPLPARAPRDPPQPPRRTDAPRKPAAACAARPSAPFLSPGLRGLHSPAGRPLLSRAPAPQQLRLRRPRGRRRRQRRRNVLPAERGRLPRSEGPALRPRPSPPARLADWPAGLRRAWPIKRGDGEAGAEAQKERGRESLGQERLGAEGPGAGRSLTRRAKPEEAGRGGAGRGRGRQGRARPVCGCSWSGWPWMLGFRTPFFSPPVLLERFIHSGKQRGVSKLHAGSQTNP